MMRQSVHSLGLAAALSALIACGSPNQSQDESVEQPMASAPIEQTVEYDRKELLRDIGAYVPSENCPDPCNPKLTVSLPSELMPVGISNERTFEVFTYEFEGKTKMGVSSPNTQYSLSITDAGADGWGPGDVLRDDLPLGDDEHQYFFDNPKDREKGKELYDLVMNAIYKARASGVEFE